MQLTKLRAAPVLRAEVPPCAPAGEADGGTASQLIRSVRPTIEGRELLGMRRAGWPSWVPRCEGHGGPASVLGTRWPSRRQRWLRRPGIAGYGLPEERPSNASPANGSPAKCGRPGAGRWRSRASSLVGTDRASTTVLASRPAAEQRDEADEGRFGERARMVTGCHHGVAGFENRGRGARPSQLIASVRPTRARGLETA